VNPNDALQVKKTSDAKTIPFPENTSFIDANPFVKLSFNADEIQSHLVGDYNYTNIVAATTIGTYFKVEPLQIKEAIENYVPTNILFFL